MRPMERYARVQAETATPERLTALLFQAARRHLDTAARALEGGHRDQAAMPLQKANDIIAELAGTLKPEVAPKLCEQLTEVYTFTLLRISAALTTGSAGAVREAERVFNPVALAFEETLATNPSRAA